MTLRCLWCGMVAIWRPYRKILKISLGAYIFQRPLLRGSFLEGLIFGGAYLRSEICVSKSIGLALQLEVNLPFLLSFTLYLRAIFQVQAPGGLIFGGGDLAEGFCVTGLGAYFWRGLYTEWVIFGILRYIKSAGVSGYESPSSSSQMQVNACCSEWLLSLRLRCGVPKTLIRIVQQISLSTVLHYARVSPRNHPTKGLVP